MAKEYKTAVLITGDSTGAQKAIKLTAEQLDSLNTKVKATGSSTFKLSGDWQKQLGGMAVSAAKWGAATAAAAAAGTALFVKSAIDQADAANILAGKLGITTEALTKLQYSAKISDVSQQALEGGLKKLTVTLTAAQDPASKAAQYLSALGLSARELIALPADQQLGRIGDALNNVENQSQRAAIAQKIFGKAGMDLLPVLAEGSAGIRNLGEEAGRLGIVIGSDFAARAGVFNDNLDRIRSAVSGLGLSVAERLMPRLEELTDRILLMTQDPAVSEGLATLFAGIGNAALDAAEGVGKLASGIAEINARNAAQSAQSGLAGLNAELADLIAKRDSLAADGSVMGSVLGSIASAVPAAASLIAGNAENLSDLDRQIIELQGLKEKNLKAIDDYLSIDVAAIESTKRTTDQSAAVRAHTAALSLETAEQKSAAAAAAAANKKIAESVSQLQFELVQLTRNEKAQRIAVALRNAGADAASAEGKSIAKLTAALFDHEESMKRNKAALDEMDRGMADLEGGMDKTAAKSDPWAEALQGAVERVDSAFVDMWKNIGSGFDSFADSLKDAFKQLLAELANMAITRPIVMRFASALGLGGSASALAGGGGGLGGIGSLLSAGKSAFQGFQSGGLSGGLNALIGGSPTGGMLGESLSSLRFGLGDLSSKLGLDGLAGKFNSQGLEIKSTGANLLDIGANIGAGFLGSLAGDKIGSALFGDRKTTGIGSGIGGIIGSASGPLGTAIGSFLGSLAENAIGKIFGLGDQAKFGKLGITTGGGSNIPTDGSALKTITAASGLQLSAVAKRTDAESALKLLDGFTAIDSSLTELARSVGVTVNFAGKVLGNTSLNVDNQGPNNSFGVGARLDKFNADKIKTSADDFARAWISEIDDQLTGRIKSILGDTSKRTAEQIVQIFGFASKLDKLLKIDVLAEVTAAAAAKTKTLLDVYGEATDAVVNLAHEYDGSLESMTSLTDALQSQKVVAAQLAVAYEEVSQLVDATFGNAISTIEESMLSEADLYQRRRSQIASLTDELSTTIDPAKIAGLVQQIDALAGSAFQMLDETQRKQVSQEFITFLEQAQTIADQQIQAGRDSLAGRETATANAIDLEVMNTAALTQQAAANTFAAAVTTFAGVMGAGFNLDPATIAAYIAANKAEVNA
jgi:hypothetical protein